MTPTMTPADLEPARRTRARLILAGLAVLVVLVLLALIAFLIGTTTPPTAPVPGTGAAPARGGTPNVDTAPGGGAALPGAAADPAAGGWDVAAETTLATAPMLGLPDSAVLPHALATTITGAPLTLPRATQTVGRLVPGGFPDTPEGALGQLAALTTAGFAGADPQTYAQAYASVALPGAPDPQRARLSTDLTQFRARAGLPASGAVASLSVTYQPAQGLIKGTTDQGQYVVACVLGDLTIGANGQSISSGAGDCEALRFSYGNWGISPGAPAAVAPLAWPGTAEAAAAGYRAVR